MFAKVILYAVLATASLAMLLLLIGFVCLHFGLVALMGLMYALAGKIMLLAFGLLLLLGGGLALQAIYKELAGYWRREASALRRILTLQMRKESNSQLIQQQKKQLRYWQEFKRQRMLAANNKKHSRELYKAITAELQTAIAAERYKALQKQLKHYRNQANPEAMLALREQVLCQTSNAG
jgi:parvulin-like peptidyl-prolyl isomerase